jgi:hypothetical protein
MMCVPSESRPRAWEVTTHQDVAAEVPELALFLEQMEIEGSSA